VNLDFVRRLGADTAIDYKEDRFEDIANEVDIVYDLIGGQTQDRSWATLKRGGIIVSTLTEPDQDRAAEEGKRGVRYVAKPNAAQLGEIAALIDAGKVRPHIARTFPLEQAAEAQKSLEHDHIRGKIVLMVDS
jgi:NADPH:quinone reductase-like Zn-dependent oxidoreductase